MSQVDFDSFKDQTGCCGAWCGSCVVGNGVLKLLTQRYQELIRAYGLKEWGPKDIDYEKLDRALTSVHGMPSCSGCRQGGGRENCELRKCAVERGYQFCSDCQASKSCPHREILEYMRSGARAAGIIFREDTPDGVDSVEEWISRISSTWPCFILFERKR
jgi:hypothetical protein